jgi:hypothetical protein
LKQQEQEHAFYLAISLLEKSFSTIVLRQLIHSLEFYTLISGTERQN